MLTAVAAEPTNVAFVGAFEPTRIAVVSTGESASTTSSILLFTRLFSIYVGERKEGLGCV